MGGNGDHLEILIRVITEPTIFIGGGFLGGLEKITRETTPRLRRTPPREGNG